MSTITKQLTEKTLQKNINGRLGRRAKKIKKRKDWYEIINEAGEVELRVTPDNLEAYSDLLTFDDAAECYRLIQQSLEASYENIIDGSKVVGLPPDWDDDVLNELSASHREAIADRIEELEEAKRRIKDKTGLA